MSRDRKNKPKRRGGGEKNIGGHDMDDQWTLKDLIDFAGANEMLKRYNPATLHDALREPRNFIHPMKEIRGGELVDEHTAQVSLNMVRGALAELVTLPEP